MFKRKIYVFKHANNKEPCEIKAFSEKKAWKKMRSIIRNMIYGKNAIIYYSAQVDKEMGNIKLIKVY